MKFSEAMSNPDVTTIRKTYWDNPEDRVNLPPILPNGIRGLWATLDADDGLQRLQTDVLAMTLDDGSDDWEVWVP